jgi:uncharacterized repeat protein (TIGR03803 family)
MTKPSCWKMRCAILAICAATAIAAPAQTFTVLENFNSSVGVNPLGSLVQGVDGDLYGTTSLIQGSVYKITQAGVLVIYSFCSIPYCLDGRYPESGLVLATDGSLYGTTLLGGTNGDNGTVYKITPAGQLVTIYSFCGQPGCADGDQPWAGLVQGMDGNFYGTTLLGGANGYGTIFKITPSGSLTTLYSFDLVGGYSPQSALIQATDGSLYGTNELGGAFNGGNIFKITPQGKLTTIYSFCGPERCAGVAGYAPYAGLLQGSDGNFYGVTQRGPGFQFHGALFRITTGGELTAVYAFCSQANCADGAYSLGTLIQATDGNFYGTSGGGANDDGTIFSITPAGTLTTLHSFDGTDGAGPYGLVQGTNGVFYGITDGGGTGHCYNGVGCGVAYSFDTGLGPFVAFVRGYGRVGQTGGILGQGLTGTTSVSLNGTPASFTVVSDTYISATVPAGATTGYVTVTTPSGTLTSNVPFRVTQ